MPAEIESAGDGDWATAGGETVTVSGVLSGLLFSDRALGPAERPDKAERIAPIGRRESKSRQAEPADRVELSLEALAPQETEGPSPQTATEAQSAGARTPDDAEAKEVERLKRRDAEVRRHEQAHLAAAGPYAQGGPTFEYQTGPDGRRYAVGGEVQIDTSPIKGDPEATIQKMQTIRAAALAPAEPSGQDRSVAAKAAAEIQKARAEQAAQGSDTGSGESADAGRAGRAARAASDRPTGYTRDGTADGGQEFARLIDAYA